MPKTLTTALKSLKPKAPLIQGPTSLVELLGASASLHLLSLYLLLISLLGALVFEVKNALMLLGETATSSRLIKIEGSYSSMVLNAEGLKNSQSFFGFHRKAKQMSRPFNLQKQVKPRLRIAPGGSAPKAKVYS